MNIKQKLTTGLAAGTAMATMFSSAAFAANVNVSGNMLSKNNVVVVEANKTVVSQSNAQVVTNVVNSNANTGGNKSAFNMGSTGIVTGPASSTVTNTTIGGDNTALVGCGCPTTPTNVKVAGNMLSTTNVGVVKVNTTSVGQSNVQSVTNVVNSQANTGKNNSLFNMGGSVVGTGPAGSAVKNFVVGGSNGVATP